MVESLRWADGNIEVHDNTGSNEMACNGWLVLATERAWQQMRPFLQSFVRHRMAGRKSDFAPNGNRKVEVAKDEATLPETTFPQDD